jgi:hypothetical protein
MRRKNVIAIISKICIICFTDEFKWRENKRTHVHFLLKSQIMRVPFITYIMWPNPVHFCTSKNLIIKATTQNRTLKVYSIFTYWT